jgi:hypothetical protein
LVKPYQADIFEHRVMLRKAVCVTAEELTRMFYHHDRFTRRGDAVGAYALAGHQQVKFAAPLSDFSQASPFNKVSAQRFIPAVSGDMSQCGNWR